MLTNFELMEIDEWTIGRMFSFLTKQYIGHITKSMAHSPVERYFYPLYLIGKKSGEMSQQQLADCLLLDKVSMVRILDILTVDGLIERKINPNDRRQHLLHITEKGKPWVNEINENLMKADGFFLQFLPESEQEIFRKQLIHMCKSSKNCYKNTVEIDTIPYKDTSNKQH